MHIILRGRKRANDNKKTRNIIIGATPNNKLTENSTDTIKRTFEKIGWTRPVLRVKAVFERGQPVTGVNNGTQAFQVYRVMEGDHAEEEGTKQKLEQFGTVEILPGQVEAKQRSQKRIQSQTIKVQAVVRNDQPVTELRNGKISQLYQVVGRRLSAYKNQPGTLEELTAQFGQVEVIPGWVEQY